MSLFKSKSRLKFEGNRIPLLSMEENLRVYEQTAGSEMDLRMNPQSDADSIGVIMIESQPREEEGVPLRIDHYALTICLKGQSSNQQNQYNFNLHEQAAHLVGPGEIHSFGSTSPDYRVCVLLFHRDYMAATNLPEEDLNDLLEVPSDLSPLITFETSEFDLWKSWLNQIGQELALKTGYYNEVVRQYIILMLLSIKRKRLTATSKESETRPKHILSEFRTLIESNFLYMKSVNEYAELMHITSKHLSETIKKETDHTALHFIQQRIMHEAQYLLVYTSLNVKEISVKLNFDTPSHFIRFFKHYSGETPRKYRNSRTA